MKKACIPFVILVAFFIIGCDNNNKSQPSNGADSLAAEIRRWFAEEKAFVAKRCVPEDRAAKDSLLDELAADLDLAHATTDVYDQRMNFTVIPVRDSLLLKSGMNKNSSLLMLFSCNKAGKIISGGPVHFIPANGKKLSALPPNLFSNLFRLKPGVPDGEYRMLSSTGRWISVFFASGGRNASSATIEQDSSQKQQMKDSARWYLVTTLYGEHRIKKKGRWVGNTSNDCRPALECLCPDRLIDTGEHDVDTVVEHATLEEAQEAPPPPPPARKKK